MAMTYMQKRWRHEARTSGARVAQEIRNAVASEKDARGWDDLVGRMRPDTDPEVIAVAQERAKEDRVRADRWTEAAVEDARRAWRLALRSEESA